MIYDMDIIRVQGGFVGESRVLAKCNVKELKMLGIKPYRSIWNVPYKRYVTAIEFKVYYCYDKKDEKSIIEWRNTNDIKKRRHNRSGSKA